MTLDELKSRVIFQVNADDDDLDDYEPAITGYVNIGYDEILNALTQLHLDMGFIYASLSIGSESPLVPKWTHDAIADYATYLVYRNGNTQKQSRGQMYLQRFNEVYAKCRELRSKVNIDLETGEITMTSTKPPQFFNVYPPIVETGFDPFSE